MDNTVDDRSHAKRYSVWEPQDVLRFFAGRRKHVLTFAGFGELGYDDPGVVARVAHPILADHEPASVIVNTGTLLHRSMSAGIADVLELARRLGFETTSIHPSVALRAGGEHRPSPFADRVFFVDDSHWGSIVGPAGEVSRVLQVLLDVTTMFVAIGGGRYAAHELTAFLERGKPVAYFPALMNKTIADAWHEQVGIAEFDYRGEAFAVWSSHRAQSRGSQPFAGHEP